MSTQVDYFDHKHYDLDSSPKLCYHCGHDVFNEITVDTIEHIVCEYKVVCTGCDTTVGYWAYGHYDPCYSNLHPTEGP